MRKALLTLLFAIALLPALAQKSNPQLRLMLVADTWDDRVGRFAEKQLERLQNWIDDYVASAIDMPISSESATFRDERCFYDTIIQALENFECDTQDIVIFWYLGHGVRSTKDTSIFPQICPMAERSYEDQFISLEAIMKHLMAKKPRLCVVVGDCCNSENETVTPKNNLVFASRNAGGTHINKNTGDFARALFGESEGGYIISASRAGEFSYSNGEQGFFFTNNFIKNFHKLSQKREYTGNPWDELMERLQIYFDSTKVKVMDDFGDISYEQMHPQYRFEPREVVRPRNRYVYTIDQSLVEALQVNIKDSVADHTDEILARYFGKDAYVQTIGEEKDKFIETLRAEDYLHRINNFQSLEKVSIRAMYPDEEGKVKRLIVHEVYYDEEEEED